MRFPYLIHGDCFNHYQQTRQRVDLFEPKGQSSWHGHASNWLILANLAYALGYPLQESRDALRESIVAYRELFSRRGQTAYTRTMYHDGKPLPQETIVDDGYTSVDSFNAALVALIVHDIAATRDLVELAGHSPDAKYVSPKSEVCTTNQQTLSHALNAVLVQDMELADHEARKFTVRRCNQFEQQCAATISAIACNGDVLSELEALLFYHAKMAKRRDNWTNSTTYLCLPGLGLANLAIQLGRIELSDLSCEDLHAPSGLLQDC